MVSESISIIKSSIEDLKSIALCHRNTFPNSLSSLLGHSYCVSMFSWYLNSKKTFLFHIENSNNKCVGYCGGMLIDGISSLGSASGMFQHSFNSALLALLLRPWLFLHPELKSKLPLVIKNIKIKLGLQVDKQNSTSQNSQICLTPKMGLVVIGIDPQFQGLGFSSLILDEFERISKQEYNINQLQLSVLSKNVKAINAYKKQGWVVELEFENSVNMIKIIN